MADMDQKDSTHRALVVNHSSGLCMVGFTGDSAPRALFLPFVRPKMLHIIAGRHQKDSCPRYTGKLTIWEMTRYFFYGPLYLAVTCSVLLPEECVRRFSWETTSGMFPCSALFGTTVDACSAQSTGRFGKKSHVFYVNVGLGFIPRGWYCRKLWRCRRRSTFAVVDVAVISKRQVPGSSGRYLRPGHRQDVQVLRRASFAAFCCIFRTPSAWT